MKAACGGRQEQHGRGHVGRLAETPSGRPSLDLAQVVGRHAVRHLRPEVARRDRVHGDAPGAELAGERPREPVEGSLGGAVHGQPSVAGEPDDRRHVDDAPGGPGQHAPHGGPGDGHRRLEVEVDDGVDVVVAEQCDDALACEPGIVHQHVDAAEPLGDAVDERRARRPVGELDRLPHEPVGHVLVGLPRLGLVGWCAAARRHRVAGVEERLHQAGAQPPAAAGDDHDRRP